MMGLIDRIAGERLTVASNKSMREAIAKTSGRSCGSKSLFWRLRSERRNGSTFRLG